MVNRFLKLNKGASLSPSKGSFLSDKSYKYDTVYYISKFVLLKIDKNNIFNRKINLDECTRYIENVFSLREGSSAAVNYLREVLNLLLFSNILEKIDQDKYYVKRLRELKFIAKRVENAYLFLFVITYKTFQNEKILDLYFKYIDSLTNKEKEFYLERLFEFITKNSKRVANPNSVWGKLIVKYPLMVLGLFYRDKVVSKDLNIGDEYITVKSISMNVSGTKTSSEITKKNDYIFYFDLEYVEKFLKRFKHIKNL